MRFFWRSKHRDSKTSWPKADDASLAVSIDGEAVRVSVSEITDSLPHVLTSAEAKHPWSAPKHDYKLTGRLQLQVANLPPYMGPIRRTWADGKYQQIENCIGNFIIALRVAAAAIKKNRQETEERERRWAEERKWKEEERQKAEEQERKSRPCRRAYRQLGRSGSLSRIRQSH
jgi:hypothetical protein